MRNCPVCYTKERLQMFTLPYLVPDGWTLPSAITWYTCDKCDMVYGDGEFNQSMLDEYYRSQYGYGINSPDNRKRLEADACWIIDKLSLDDRIIDFGGVGDNGESVIVSMLKDYGFSDAHCTGAGDELPSNCDLIYASHVLEHIYDLPKTMSNITSALADDGLLIIDVPDATGLLQHWKKPILDYNTKHINHFTLRNLLDSGKQFGFESVLVKPYELEYAPAFQVHFKQMDTALLSAKHVVSNILARVNKLKEIDYPVNVWGLSDIAWVLLSYVNLNVLNYIDNDPAYRSATYKGIPVVERPDNDAPIVIMAQGQRERLIENIRKTGIKNRIIEV